MPSQSSKPATAIITSDAGVTASTPCASRLTVEASLTGAPCGVRPIAPSGSEPLRAAGRGSCRLEAHQGLAVGELLALAHADLGDHAVARCADDVLHLHRLQHRQVLAA